MPPHRRPFSSKAFLLKEMVVRDVRARYSGSSLGVLWAFALPVLSDGDRGGPVPRRLFGEAC